MENSDSPAVKLGQTIESMPFYHFRMETVLQLTPEADRLIDAVSLDYHYRRFRRSRGLLPFSGYFFDKDYKKNRAKYPPLVNRNAVAQSQFTEMAPGSPILSTGVICYFRDMAETGAAMTSPLGRPFTNFNLLISEIKKQSGTWIASLKWDTPAGGGANRTKQALVEYHEDIENLSLITRYVPELQDLSLKTEARELRSGDLVNLLSSLLRFFELFRKFIAAAGLVKVKIREHPEIQDVVDGLIDGLRDAVMTVTIDLLGSELRSDNYGLAIEGGAPKLFDTGEKTGVIGRFMDFIINLFTGGKKKEETPAAARNSQPPEAEKPDRAVDKPAAGGNRPDTVECPQVLELYHLIQKFKSSLIGDLAPVKSESGEVMNFKSGFDQFDELPSSRNINYDGVNLSGALAHGGGRKFTDQQIIDSTYWIYDRAEGILTKFDIISPEVAVDEARSFIRNVREFCVAPRDEVNEKKKVSTLQQFRVNIRRLFASGAVHSRYSGLIDRIADKADNAAAALDRAVEEWKK